MKIDIFLLYIYLIFLGILGIGCSLLISILSAKICSLFIILVCYILLGNNLQTIFNLLDSAPPIYRTSMWKYLKYKLFLVCIYNSLIITFLFFIATMLFFLEFLVALQLLSIAIIFSMLLTTNTVTLKNQLLKYITFILILGYTSKGYVPSFKHYIYIFMLFIIILLIVYLLIQEKNIPKTIDVAYLRNNDSKNVLSSFFISSIRSNLKNGLINLLIVGAYLYFAQRFDLLYSVLPFNLGLVIFDNLIYTELTMLKNSSISSRALFLKSAHIKKEKFLYGNIFYKNILNVSLLIATMTYLTIIDYLKGWQILFSIVIICSFFIYFYYIEGVVSTDKHKRPNIIEEYVIMLIIILLGGIL